MLGMSDVSIAIGIIFILLSLSNYMYYIFVEKNFSRDVVPTNLDSSNQNSNNPPNEPI